MTAPDSADKAVMQKTIQNDMCASGIGLFTGEKVSIKILPAEPNTGILFKRIDLPDRPVIPAHLSFVREAPRCTRLADSKASIHMVEHLMSAFCGMGIDNAIVEVEGPEILAADGSARLFVDLIELAGVQEQSVPRKKITITRPIYWSEGEVHLVALPADEFRISYTLHYPQSSLLKSQFYTISVSPARFRE